MRYSLTFHATVDLRFHGPLAELATRTRRIGLATSVISAWGRTPATVALGAATLRQRTEGRFSLGIGAGSPPLTEGFHGVRWDRPLTRLRHTLTAVRALLAGERLPSPREGARPLRLGVVPDMQVPIVLAALSPASIRLAGELADEWEPFLWAQSRVGTGGRSCTKASLARGFPLRRAWASRFP